MKKISIKKDDIPSLLSAVLFFGVLAVFALATIVAPKSERSDTENRTLERFPQFTVQRVMDKRFMNGIESYLSDHFIGRLSWIRAKDALVRTTGKPETNGVFVSEDRLIQRFSSVDYDITDTSVEAINNFAAAAGKPVYLMIVPTAADIYKDSLPKNVTNVNQKKYIEYVYGSMSGNINTLDVYGALQTTRDEYIYYRSDHHWTTRGAYYAYYSCGKKMDFTPFGIESFDIEYASYDFRGSLYSKSLYDKTPADLLEIYHNTEQPDAAEVILNNRDSYDSMYFMEYTQESDKYSTFLGRNQPFVTIKSGAEEGEKLLIFKDSYAHCFAPFLMPHFSEIALVDMRYIEGSYTEYCNIGDYDKVLFLYNAENFASDSSISRLR